jgi:general L-amino acid transport system permease protein
LRVIRVLSIGYIEIWRGVPLLTVQFMSAVVMPLFLPEGVSVDLPLRAMAAMVLFNAAHRAEVTSRSCSATRRARTG